MIRLSRLTDYGVVAMAHLAISGGRRSVADISEDTGVPEPTVAKVMKSLTRSGLLASTRGAAGGYELARKPEDINILEIIEALEGHVALTACVEGGEGCEVETVCPLSGHWEQVNKAVRDAISSVRLSDIIKTFDPNVMFPVHPDTLTVASG